MKENEAPHCFAQILTFSVFTKIDLYFCPLTDRTVKVWDLNTGEETLSCAGHKRDVVAVTYCPKTQRIFGSSQNIIKVKNILERLA